jgi:WS/DGAT/MGAT family acyltransferase
MERMNPLDATFLAVEDAVNHMHIGSVEIFEGPPPRYDDVYHAIEAALPLVPRYRQKVLTAPASIGRPVWVDDPAFRLDYHLRHVALPQSDPDDGLRRLVGWVMSQQLDRHKPLWENWMVEGLVGGRWALITKVHHCMVDGIAGTDLVAVLLDQTPDAPARVADGEWAPPPAPGTRQLAWHSLAGTASAPCTDARWVFERVIRPVASSTRLWNAIRGLLAVGGVLRSAPVGRRSRLTGPIGPHRRWDHTRVPLGEVRTVRTALGGTVNDVVLALVTRGMRELLVGWGEEVRSRDITTLVPVSVRGDARGVLDNRVSAVFAALPVGIDDPLERLATIRVRLDQLKSSGEIDTGETLMAAIGFAPPALHALIARLVVHRQHNVETVVTNVPGPQFPLYLAGRPMVAGYPYVPLGGNIRIGIAIWSYLGTLHFGVTGDDDAAPDIHRVCAGIDEEMRELVELAESTPHGPMVSDGSGAPRHAAP